MRRFIGILKKCILFKGIEEDEILSMLSCLDARVVDARKGEYIFSEGEAAKYVGIVLTGEAQIVRNDFFGNRTIVAAIMPGELFGESFACAEVEELPVSVAASENSEIMLIDCKRIITTCSSSCRFHNMIIHNLLQVLATKNLAFNKKIEITSKRTTRDKLMTYLLSQAKIHGSSSFEIPFDRQELADYLGVERSAMSKEISKMKEDGLIECERSWFKVKGDVI